MPLLTVSRLILHRSNTRMVWELRPAVLPLFQTSQLIIMFYKTVFKLFFILKLLVYRYVYLMADANIAVDIAQK